MCVITFETNSPPFLENRSSPALAITCRFVVVMDVKPASRGVAQFDSGISLNSERLVNRKLKVGPETAAVCAWRCVEKEGSG